MTPHRPIPNDVVKQFLETLPDDLKPLWDMLAEQLTSIDEVYVAVAAIWSWRDAKRPVPNLLTGSAMHTEELTGRSAGTRVHTVPIYRIWVKRSPGAGQDE